MRKLKDAHRMLFPVMASSLLPFVCNAECDYRILASVPGPGPALIAVVQEVICSGTGFATTIAIDKVLLLRSGEEPDDSYTVLALNDPDVDPVVRWVSGRE